VPEHEPQEFESCSVCARTILRGERVRDFVAPDGERHRVCSLCKERAEAAGWVPAEMAGSRSRGVEPRRRGNLQLRERLRRAAERARPPVRVRLERGDGRQQSAESEARPRKEQQRRGAAEPGRQGKDPAEPKQRRAPSRGQPARASRGAPAPAEGPQRRMRHAIERFNHSDQPKVVAGLTRSLGAPRAAVSSTSTKPPRGLITIAWELSWYRWEVALDDDGHGVREVAKGKELSELTEDQRGWNASVGEDGTIRPDAGERVAAVGGDGS
jgi:hypothetical protein